ncbi:hypothetical protein MRB53_027405 [Persea americana]|uniref:Uncharacterized protein n=1 Tax=Persea americana TaxID=3435 RepID=A0ACC2LKW5_PERAE|nr:hypothetical protein MRB53_027405 [Persea americana]
MWRVRAQIPKRFGVDAACLSSLLQDLFPVEYFGLMVYNSIRSARLRDIIHSPVELLSRVCFLKAAQCLDVNAEYDETVQSVTSDSTLIFGTGFREALNKTMSGSLKPLKCMQQFHSNVSSSTKGVQADGAGLPSVESDEKCPTEDSVSMRQNQTCSTNVQHTPDIERKYVHHVYDAIAPHFSSTRFAKWPKVSMFLNSLMPGSVILDAGCGNGKYLGLNPRCFYIGCDISAPLIQICAGRGHEVMVADAVNLPYRSGFGDAAISIAVLHHLSTESRRRKAIEELVRVVQKGGLVLITVWAVEQEDRSVLSKWTPLTRKYEEEWIGPGSPHMRSSPSTVTLESIPEAEESSHRDVDEFKALDNQNPPKESKQQPKEIIEVGAVPSKVADVSVAFRNGSIDNHQEYFVPWHLPYHRAEIGGASSLALESGLAKKDDKKGAVVYNRYYHVFIEGELERLVSGIENAFIRDKFYDKSNWCIILEKS